MPKETKSLRDGNGRVARLARWLAAGPASETVDLLLLEHKEDGEWKRLQFWPKSQATQQLATTIDSMITELANELGAYVIARVVWFHSESGSYWTEHALRVQPEDMEGMQAFGGDNVSIAIQNQRHQERLAGNYIGGTQTAIQVLRETLGDMRTVTQQTQAENQRLRDELSSVKAERDEARDENAQLRSMLDEALAANEKAQEQTQEKSQEGQIIQFAMAALAKQQQQAPKAG